MESTNAHRNPAQVMMPAQICVPSNASGIMVSASLERIAPAASGVIAACIATGTVPKRVDL